MANLTSNQVCNICCIHYNAGLRCCSLGADLTSTQGGYLFAKQGRNAWIIAPAAQQVSRGWYERGDAVTVAQATYACGDWFVPSRFDLLLGYSCRSFWDSFSNTLYWSSTEINSTFACSISQVNGCLCASPKINSRTGLGTLQCVRAFRRVFY
jgi:hypothetical protein